MRCLFRLLSEFHVHDLDHEHNNLCMYRTSFFKNK